MPGVAWVIAALVALLSGCASLPSLEARSQSVAMTDTAATRLGRAVAQDISAHPGKTGIHALPVSSDAFAARVLLAAAAEKSLDIQYYVWHDDQTGYLLYEAAWRAAERGVRVRILLDDANTKGLDETIAALDAHPNIEVRLYNPLMQRNARLLDFATDFTRVNRRMHNKSFTADNQASIVGGRNVGNEYFAAGEGVAFADLDVVAIGPVVREVSAEFDLYWNSPSAYPAALVIGPACPDAAEKLEARFAEARADPQSVAYSKAVRETPLVQDLLAGRLPFEWASAQVVSDHPAKTLDVTGRTDVLLLSELLPAIGRPETSFDLVSPYFVPGDEGTAALQRLARGGVKVRVLTNSLAATDVAAVHAGYAKRRCDLLESGVELYELKPSASVEATKTKGKAGSSSAVQLHAKTFALDRRRIFVGSFNFDQRSAHLNTEMGLVIDSPALAQRVSATLDEGLATTAYQVRIAADGRCPDWVERTPAGEVLYDVEPVTSAGQRAWIQFLEGLPIEWLL
ncbi:MAG TPA: phospholipase D family protein [Casimicrobiaceae bacterium]|nr:phospholipase D family protein [Casimicrobiaceae bacterium]